MNWFSNLFKRKSNIVKTEIDSQIQTDTLPLSNDVNLFLDFLTAIKDENDEKIEKIHDELMYRSIFLISDEYGEMVEQFNNGVAVEFNLDKVECEIDCQGEYGSEVCTTALTYRNQQVKWYEKPNIDSDLLMLLKLAELVALDIEIRFDKYTDGSSDIYCFALPPRQWQELENDFGKQFVRSQFLPINEEFTINDFEFTDL